MSDGKSTYTWGSQLAGAAIFAALGLAALYGFVLFATPPERHHREPFRPAYDEKPLMAALSGDTLDRRLAEIAAAGVVAGRREVGRMSGSPGCANMEDLITKVFREAGLDVRTQALQVTVPVTDYCEILDEKGVPLPDVTLYPFAPCGLMPIVLPTNGLRGELVFMESSDLRFLAGRRPEDSIVVTYLGAGEWSGLAALGVPAVIVVEDEMKKALATDKDAVGAWDSMVLPTETTYPRFYARGPLPAYAGKRLTLRCKVTWQSRTVRNIVGVLKARAPTDEALVLSAYYDSNSLVPDLAPGAEQALSPAVLLELARALAPYRGQLRRDVVFAATAGHAQSMAGVGRLLEPIEKVTLGTEERIPLETRIASEETWLGYAQRGRAVVDDERWWAHDPRAAFSDRWKIEDAAFRAWFEKCVRTVLGELNLEHKEVVLARRLDYLRAGSPVYRDGFDDATVSDAERKRPENRHPLLTAFLAAQADDNRSGNMMSQPFVQMVTRDEFPVWDMRGRLRGQLARLTAHHEQRLRELRDTAGIRDLFAPYQRLLTLNLDLGSGGARELPDLSLAVGMSFGSLTEPQVTDIAQTIKNCVPQVGRRPDFEVIQWGAKDAIATKDRPNIHYSLRVVLESTAWTMCGHLAFSLLNYGFLSPKLCTPEDTFADIRTGVLRRQLAPLGRAVLSLADGQVEFKTIPADIAKRIVNLRGQVFGAAGTGSIVPTHPMGVNTVVRCVPPGWRPTALELDTQYRGMRVLPILACDPYGRYERSLTFSLGGWSGLMVNAARFDDQGLVRFYKNASPSSQRVYPNENIGSADILASNRKPAKLISIGMFRCAPVSLFERSNPMTLQGFKGLQYLTRSGLSGPANFRYDLEGYVEKARRVMVFLEPDLRFYLALQDGASDNKEILENRAFLLNVAPDEPLAPDEPDIYGRGFLAADTPNITFAHAEAAASMLRTNGKRLALQKRYSIADELMLSFHKQGEEWLATARELRAKHDIVGAVLAAGKSLSYASANHPVIRKKISNAVIGILWYLALLVPFVFFFEKLVFGFADIRKQLLANGLIFLAVFLLLRLFHPAFQMVRSSIMILLGFVILLLTLLVTTMVGGKFKQNIKDLRGKEGRIEGADINRGGVIGTAFMLGLNNMRRRKVRTGLTAVTLILLTFVMICFTSISTDLVNAEYATGKAAWNGILFRKANYLALDANEVGNLQQQYGKLYPVATHSWLVQVLNDWGGNLRNAEIVVDREFTVGAHKIDKRAMVNASVALAWNEPEFSGIAKLLRTNRGWFPRPPVTDAEVRKATAAGYKEKRLVILPDKVAEELEIKPADVNAGEVEVSIRGDTYVVQGIIDGQALNDVIGLDGRSILPYDINSIQSLGRNSAGMALVPEDVKHLPANQLVLVNKHPTFKADIEEIRTAACGILFPKAKYNVFADGPELNEVGYKDQRRLVTEFLERTGLNAYYAVDGVAYYGSRTRSRTVEGLLELLIPILIAALTVFNTMRGSVYERRDEIYVYNAVGIAPNHVFYMFMAEALVYAVVGAMLGYLLSQATGRALTALNLTGGMNMNYSSIESIYASLTIMIAVLGSTLIPARDAARLASPADQRTWSMPVAQGDVLSFNLPFTFTLHDRVAVISYFQRWLDSNGEGSSGPFFCAPPQAQVRKVPGEERSGGLLPGIATTIWNKPFDLGVSQRLEIWLPTDPETSEYIANIRLVRLSGTAAAWNRTTKPFLGVLRKQFLNWRAATPAEREDMFGAAKALLAQCPVEQPADEG